MTTFTACFTPWDRVLRVQADGQGMRLLVARTIVPGGFGFADALSDIGFRPAAGALPWRDTELGLMQDVEPTPIGEQTPTPLEALPIFLSAGTMVAIVASTLERAGLWQGTRAELEVFAREQLTRDGYLPGVAASVRAV